MSHSPHIPISNPIPPPPLSNPQFHISLHNKQSQALEKIQFLESKFAEVHPRNISSPLSMLRLFQIQAFPRIFQELAPTIPQIANYQYNEQQTRYFLVLSFEEMFSLLRKLREECRCIYEIIRENDPCFLYFDIEREYQDGFDLRRGEEVLQKMMRHLGEELRVQFGEDVYKGDFARYIVDMDSSTESKFSRHVLVRLRTKDGKFAVFRDNREMGNFVKNWIQKMFADEEMRDLVFYQSARTPTKGPNSDSNSTTNTQWRCIIDDAVYTKNRAFRLLQNTKYGKKAYLRITQQTYEHYKVKDNEIVKSPMPLMSSLVRAHKWFARSLVTCVPLKEQSRRLLEMPLEKCTYLEKALQDKMAKMTYRVKVNPHSNYATESANIENLTHQALDDYLLNLIPEGNAFIRSVKYFDTTDQLIYEIGGNRFCHNIGRQHRSNHVYYIANLRYQTIVQKCTDPDCGSYRSMPYRYPDDCVPVRKDLTYVKTPMLSRSKGMERDGKTEEVGQKDLTAQAFPPPQQKQQPWAQSQNPLNTSPPLNIAPQNSHSQQSTTDAHPRTGFGYQQFARKYEKIYDYSATTPPPLYKLQGVRIPHSFRVASDSSQEDEEFYEELEKLERQLGVHEPPKKRRRKSQESS